MTNQQDNSICIDSKFILVAIMTRIECAFRTNKTDLFGHNQRGISSWEVFRFEMLTKDACKRTGKLDKKVAVCVKNDFRKGKQSVPEAMRVERMRHTPDKQLELLPRNAHVCRKRADQRRIRRGRVCLQVRRVKSHAAA